MSKPGFAFGLNTAKKLGPTKPASRSRPVAFGGDDDSDDSGAGGEARAMGVEVIGEEEADLRTKSKSKSTRIQPPNLKPKAKERTSALFGDLSSSLTSRKHAQAAQEVDPTVYEYDSVYDSMKRAKSGAKDDVEPGGERKPKYMQGLMRAAQTRKRDALIAEETKVAREREAEGDEFADKETIVTEAYKRQLEENKRLKEEERRREEEDAKRNKGGGMSAFYRRFLDKDEERHAEAVKAVQERQATTADDEAETERDDEKEEAALAQELNAKGASVAVNEDGHVVDKRQLLKGGLNLGGKKRGAATERQGQQQHAHHGSTRAGQTGLGGKKAMWERQSRMVEEQRAKTQKRRLEADDEMRRERERETKSRKTEEERLQARERYLARKKAAEEAKGN
ncbi:coiled-coil domain-containing protein 55 [Ophiocordyceps camponoti-floridani]|uniref:Coiled-coil domain-containing protein 55 n=1 Tax=Ophiocordyceps camponoti-floridani TaxID=2030778 RepID=A0A8H4VDU5_9HYPO|nr:coiled-coil domain-containing protein 55 [Ophiocordyceps camponoti-floridani]